MEEEKIVLDLLHHEVGPSGFQVNDALGKWEIRRIYTIGDGVQYCMSWSANAYYHKGKVQVIADYLGETEFCLADPQFGANLRYFLARSWGQHLEEIKWNGF